MNVSVDSFKVQLLKSRGKERGATKQAGSQEPNLLFVLYEEGAGKELSILTCTNSWCSEINMGVSRVCRFEHDFLNSWMLSEVARIGTGETLASYDIAGI
jgi:hypothetical protein